MRDILAYLGVRGIMAWRNNTGAMAIPAGRGGKSRYVRFGVRGQADITGILKNGIRLEIEVKRPDFRKPAAGSATISQREQQAFLDAIRAQGGCAGCATSLDDAEKILAGKRLDILRGLK